MIAAKDKEATRLREVLQTSLENGNRAQAADAFRGLAAMETHEPRWPHRLGETLSRLGLAVEAEDAYVQAATLYASQGFLARAIAVAKLAVALNPARADLLRDLDPAPAQNLRRERRASPPSLVPAPPTPHASIVPAVLEPQAGADADEVRFEDAPDSCTLEVVGEDFVDPSLFEEELTDVSGRVSGDDTADLDAEKLSRMSGATLFADIPREALVDIAHEAERLALGHREIIFLEAEPANALLVIVEGKAHVRFPGRPLIEVREGDILGETTILEGARRNAEVRARGDFVALRVGKDALDRIIAKHPRVEEVLFALLARRLVADALDTSRLFAAFDAATRADIARSFEVRRARAGTVLQEQGKRTDGLYLVLSGALEAQDPAGGAPERLPHDALIGHETLVARAPAPRTVVVAGESVLLRLPATKFTAFVLEYPPALAHIAELAAQG